jgi:crossover junction endodeoxyribonuclease RuvC
MRPRVIGMHLDLPDTHIAVTTDYGITTSRCTPAPGYGPALTELIRRHHWVARDLHLTVSQHDPVLIVVNQPADQDQGGERRDADAAGLWWHIVKDLVGDMRPLAVVGDDTAYTYATGLHRHRDPAPMETTTLATLAQRYDQERGLTTGQASALIRAAMGADHLGHPIAPVPARHRAALGHVESWHEIWR